VVDRRKAAGRKTAAPIEGRESKINGERRMVTSGAGRNGEKKETGVYN
jgi:hypothetical protein